jgi:CRISPR system Cascade subunit CasA
MIRWADLNGATQSGSLPAVLAALSRGEVFDFPGLRPHQREPWHAFTVQVAALAMLGGNHVNFDALQTESAWLAALVDLTPDFPGGEAWNLVVDDWTKPALLQPPIKAAANKEDYSPSFHAADGLDLLVTSKNHDLKQERMANGTEEHWLYALVALQTGEGFLGAGNYGISRMNGGFSSRMFMRVRPDTTFADGFQRDARELLRIHGNKPDTRPGLVWISPWDGTKSISFSSLHPLYIDTCRRIRLSVADGYITGHMATSKCARIEASNLNGITGDPWAPVKPDGSSSITASAIGFGHRQMAKLLDPMQTSRSALAQILSSDADKDLILSVAALVRGQGKTEGFHTRSIPISKVIRGRLGAPDKVLDTLGVTAVKRSGEASEMGSRLRRSLIYLYQGAPENIRYDDKSATKKVKPWEQSFNANVDAEFFDKAFWLEMEGATGPHRMDWRKRLADMARNIFQEAAAEAPRTEVKRIRAQAKARNMLESTLAKYIKEAPDHV